MRRITFVLLSIVLLLPSVPGYTQSDPRWEDGCDDRIRPAIAATTDVLDYDAACTQFRTCLQSEGHERYDLNLCQMQTFDMLLAQCPADDTLCTDGAVLFASALLVIDNYYLPPDRIVEGIPAALEAYWQGDDEAALAIYSDLPQMNTMESYYNAALPLSIAILQRRLGQPEAAFDAYFDTFDISSYVPLVWYTRSQLYGEQGRDIEAGIEAATLRYYFADDIDRLPSVVALQSQYPFDDTRLQDWLYYPVTRTFYGSNGLAFSDLTLEPSQPIQIAIFPEINVLVTFGLFNLPDQSPLLWSFRSGNGIDFGYNYPNFGAQYGENPGGINLHLEDDVLWGRVGVSFPSESQSEGAFVLAPADAPDPRETLPLTRLCEGGVNSRLEVGMEVALMFAWSPPLDAEEGAGATLEGTPYTDSPGGEMAGLLPITTQLTIIGGFECVGTLTWWQFETSDGITGWIPENRGTIYNLTPVIDQ